MRLNMGLGMSMRSVGRRLGFRAVALTMLGVSGGVMGCSDFEPIAPAADPTNDPAELFMGVTVNYPAITLSTDPSYNTVQLTATPRNGLGNPMVGLPAPVYESMNESIVTVSADGMVTAVGETFPWDLGKVVASVTLGPVTFSDTATIAVTTLSNPQILDTFSIDPVPPRGTTWSLPFSAGSGLLLSFSGQFAFPPPPVMADAGDPRVFVHAVDATGATVPDLQIRYSTLDPAIGRPNPFSFGDGQQWQLFRQGKVRAVAQTYAYGVAKADTVEFTVTPSKLAQITVGPPSTGASPVFRPAEARLAPGAVIEFFNNSADPVDITFDNPTNVSSPTGEAAGFCDKYPVFFGNPSTFYCEAGDVAFPGGGFGNRFKLRQFPQLGVYTYHTATGATGRIVITDEL